MSADEIESQTRYAEIEEQLDRSIGTREEGGRRTRAARFASRASWTMVWKPAMVMAVGMPAGRAGHYHL
eukprot:2605313-Rhodomonas_salina.4